MSLKIRECAIPKYKKDWPGKTLLMKEACPTTRINPFDFSKRLPSLIEAGVLVKLERFLSKSEATQSGHSDLYRWAEKEDQRVIKIGWRCPRCYVWHEDYIPESFIRQKKAIFVEVTEIYEEQEA
ncbi:hypothetical protein [Bilophila wadsworthia]|uniref:hypothetical protein n=1 Tax=Bilophila wadsworthia TaxID=35833 RepID=UPI001ED9D867|nr:hypothetical protein [Bilophila wadsworthia]MCG4631968.1 hypothetical protein [Bilophila wadsworthia]